MTNRPSSADKVEVGAVDPMSKLAAQMALPRCTRRQGDAVCTRAAGHDEALPNHPGTRHVYAGQRYIVLAVW